MIKSIGFLLISLFPFLLCGGNVLIVDTTGSDRAPYYQCSNRFTALGYSTTYWGVDKLQNRYLEAAQYDVLFFIIGQPFLAARGRIKKNVCTLLKQCARVQNRLILLALPSTEGKRIPSAYQNLIYVARLFLDDKNQEALGDFLSRPLVRRPLAYHTSLRLPQWVSLMPRNYGDWTRLPALTDELRASPLNNLVPMALCMNNRGNTYVIMDSAMLTADSIQENFLVVPFEEQLRDEFGVLIDRLYQEIFAFAKKPHTIEKISHVIPDQSRKGTDVIAWMELCEDDKLIDYILDARVDRLWLSLSPQFYWGAQQRFPDKKSLFLANMRSFYQKLSAKAQQRNKSIPELYIGFEIAHYRDTYRRCARDLYGHRYPDIPDPLDKQFWYQEIIEPLKIFLQEVPEIPFAGIVLDGEMYGKKKAALFSGIMRGTEQKAQELGAWLREECSKLIPSCRIVLYVPTMMTNWFYAGLMKGLSTCENPLYLMTFNTEFNKHHWWFGERDVPIKHASVLMLSKLQGLSDFAYIPVVLSCHDGIWFNRWSRLVELYQDNHWSTLENTPLSDIDKLQMMSTLSLRNKGT